MCSQPIHYNMTSLFPQHVYSLPLSFLIILVYTIFKHQMIREDMKMKKLLKKLLFLLVVCLFAAAFGYTHRRVIHAWLNGEPMPKAPAWHCWVKPENRKAS